MYAVSFFNTISFTLMGNTSAPSTGQLSSKCALTMYTQIKMDHTQ